MRISRSSIPILCLSLLPACDDGPTVIEDDPHEFSLTALKTIGSEEIELVGLNDAGQALWNEDGSGVLWSGGEISLPLLAQDLGEDGQVLGEANGDVVLWEDGAVTNLGPGTAKGLTADGRAFFGTDDGRHFWRHPDGILDEFTGPLPTDEPLPNQTEVEIHEVTEDGAVLMTSFWRETDVWNPCYETREDHVSSVLGLDIFCIPVAGENGHVLVNVDASRGGQRGHPEATTSVSDGVGPAWGHDLNASRWIVGHRLLGLEKGPPTLYRNDTVFPLNSLVASSSTVIEAAVINNRNEILGIAETEVGGHGIVILRRDRVEESQ